MVPGGVDAVVVDIGLPDRSGDALIREIRALHPLLPVVFASGLSKADVPMVEGQGKITFVAKPYTEQNLLNALRAVGVKMSKAT
jgi:FixJ family two-component response regulator